MSTELLTFMAPIIATLLGAMVSLAAFMIKKILDRLQRLEHKVANTATRKETRILIKDKTDPLQEQMERIDKKLDKIIHIMLNEGR